MPPNSPRWPAPSLGNEVTLSLSLSNLLHREAGQTRDKRHGSDGLVGIQPTAALDHDQGAASMVVLRDCGLSPRLLIIPGLPQNDKAVCP